MIVLQIISDFCLAVVCCFFLIVLLALLFNIARYIRTKNDYLALFIKKNLDENYPDDID